MNNIELILKDVNHRIIDVRSPLEYEEEHVLGAENIPLYELPLQIDFLKAAGRPLVLYCRSGNRSSMAVRLLQQHQVQQVYDGGSLYEMKNRMI